MKWEDLKEIEISHSEKNKKKHFKQQMKWDKIKITKKAT